MLLSFLIKGCISPPQDSPLSPLPQKRGRPSDFPGDVDGDQNAFPPFVLAANPLIEEEVQVGEDVLQLLCDLDRELDTLHDALGNPAFDFEIDMVRETVRRLRNPTPDVIRWVLRSVRAQVEMAQDDDITSMSFEDFACACLSLPNAEEDRVDPQHR